MKKSTYREKGRKQLTAGIGLLLIAGFLWGFLEGGGIDEISYVFDSDYRTMIEMVECFIWIFAFAGVAVLACGVVYLEVSKNDGETVGGKYRVCPFCKKETLKDREYCSHCGERINNKPSAADKNNAFGGALARGNGTVYNKEKDSHKEAPSADMIECVFCKGLIKKDQIHCTHCGRRQD